MESFGVFLSIVISVILFVCLWFAFRELNCWYFKINRRNELLKTVNDNLCTVIGQLDRLLGEKSGTPAKSPTPEVDEQV